VEGLASIDGDIGGVLRRRRILAWRYLQRDPGAGGGRGVGPGWGGGVGPGRGGGGGGRGGGGPGGGTGGGEGGGGVGGGGVPGFGGDAQRAADPRPQIKPARSRKAQFHFA